MQTSKEIIVNSTIELSDITSKITFINDGKAQILFLLGHGSPPYEFESITKEGIVIISGQFRCGYKYEHDDFHSAIVELKPNEKKTVAFDWAIPEEIKKYIGKGAISCKYKTIISR